MMWTSMLVLVLTVAAGTDGWQFHTSPAEWDAPRVFHMPFEARYSERLVLGRAGGVDATPIYASENGGYWVAGTPEDEWVLGAAGGLRARTTSRDVTLVVSTERDDFLTVHIYDRYPNFDVTVRWISEKLLFVRVWWGRVLGTDAIIDVERETFVYREQVRDGSVPFAQFQQEGARPRSP